MIWRLFTLWNLSVCFNCCKLYSPHPHPLLKLQASRPPLRKRKRTRRRPRRWTKTRPPRTHICSLCKRTTPAPNARKNSFVSVIALMSLRARAIAPFFVIPSVGDSRSRAYLPARDSHATLRSAQNDSGRGLSLRSACDSQYFVIASRRRRRGNLLYTKTTAENSAVVSS